MRVTADHRGKTGSPRIDIKLLQVVEHVNRNAGELDHLELGKLAGANAARFAQPVLNFFALACQNIAADADLASTGVHFNAAWVRKHVAELRANASFQLLVGNFLAAVAQRRAELRDRSPKPIA